ncbi:hypothetical protein CEXT_584191 [Caerostris extrusa]|uniref:Uncharacterized protein n=1 Tax=Caerostris extrusa TaxID=172846 RepID=A0AAV4T2N8_CAEEX|nr:hypothetical protein CEXT_584191 [Caerostris extrusa]
MPSGWRHNSAADPICPCLMHGDDSVKRSLSPIHHPSMASVFVVPSVFCCSLLFSFLSHCYISPEKVINSGPETTNVSDIGARHELGFDHAAA